MDRNAFSEYITDIVENHQNIDVHYRNQGDTQVRVYHYCDRPPSSPSISEAISQFVKRIISISDAAAPIVTLESLDKTKVFRLPVTGAVTTTSTVL